MEPDDGPRIESTTYDICHIFRSEERKKKNIKFITLDISHAMVRDPQMSDLRVQCSGLDVQIGREFCLIFQVQILEMGLRMVVNCYSMVKAETLEMNIVKLLKFGCGFESN